MYDQRGRWRCVCQILEVFFLDGYMVIYLLLEVVLWWVSAWLSLLEMQCYLLLSLSFCFWRWNSVRVCLKNIDILLFSPSNTLTVNLCNQLTN